MTVDQFLYAYVVDEQTYPDETIIVEEGSKGSWVYVILEGRTKVIKRTRKGTVTLGTLEEGAVFGEMAFLERGQGIRSASVIAADGPVRVGVLDSELLTRDYESLSPHLKKLLKALIVRLRRTSEKVCAIVVASN